MLSTTRETEATSVVWRIKRNGWRKKPFVDNELPYGRAEPGHPVIVDYFYHEEVRGSENTGRRNPKK